jgi:hypothetical protein
MAEKGATNKPTAHKLLAVVLGSYRINQEEQNHPDPDHICSWLNKFEASSAQPWATRCLRLGPQRGLVRTGM